MASDTNYWGFGYSGNGGDAKKIYTEQCDKSVASVIGGRKHVVIYGYAACGFKNLSNKLKEAISVRESSLEGCYDLRDLLREKITIDGHDLTTYPFHFQDYKRGLISIVLENCKRMKRGESIIPVLFCVMTSLRPREFSAENAKKSPEQEFRYRSHTGRELNFSYKLCYDPELSPEIRDIAKRTFIFVKTNGVEDLTPTIVEDLGIHIDDSWDIALRKPDSKPPQKPSLENVD